MLKNIIQYAQKQFLLKRDGLMKTYAPDQIRNIALAGHASKGKTTLLEAMLHLAGATERAGKVADGNTVTDFDAEEKKRHQHG